MVDYHQNSHLQSSGLEVVESTLLSAGIYRYIDVIFEASTVRDTCTDDLLIF